MRQNKIPVVIIIVLAMVLLAIILFAISIFSGKGKSKANNVNNSDDLITPVLELNLNTNELDQESVIIQVNAATEDKDGINYIELPDGAKIFADNTDFEVTQNGKYEFKAVGSNGAKSKLSIEVKNIRQVSSKNPYIPEGFEHIAGEVEEGYIIQDKYGNQYVWIPVETGILSRTTNGNREYEDSNASATGLVNSVAKNYGFYIARYEASSYQANGVKFAGSVEGQRPWVNITYHNAIEAAENTAKVLEYPEGIVTSLPSSYAWDTTLLWIDQDIINYSTNTSYGNYSGTVLATGSTGSDKVKNVFDLAGNVREWTTEIYKDSSLSTNNTEYDYYYDYSENNSNYKYINRVVRGGSAYINKVANSRNGYAENLTDEYWGFRVVLYKNS